MLLLSKNRPCGRLLEGEYMKREEKNQQTRRKILDSALTEFSKQGYVAGSINTICAAQGVSKGIVYHYFETKDALFLACVGECFQRLTEYIRENVAAEQGSVEKQLEHYFAVRTAFFRTMPVYRRIFCEAVIMPPEHLRADIEAHKRDFDALNIQILLHLLAQVSLRPEVSREEAIETFRQFQDFINVRYQMADMNGQAFETREENCRRALNILLYGVIEREGGKNV